MIRWEVIILLGLVAIDVGMTYILMYFLKEKLKVKDFYKYERNPMVKKFVSKFGLHKGIRISYVWTLGMWFFLIMYFSIRTNWFDFSRIIFFALGVYVLMNVVHFYTLTDVIEQVKKRKGK